MLAELVQVSTADGIKLHGALHPATEPAGSRTRQSSELGDFDELPNSGNIGYETTCDAALLLHGTGSNFYSSSLWQGLIPQLTAAGLATLAVNTRGHDLATATHGPRGRLLIGAAYETVDDCRLDVAAWLDELVARGYRRIALVGHSMGGLKAVYSQAITPHAQVARVVAISPPRLAWSVFRASPQREMFLSDLERAETLLAAGEGQTLIDVKFPIPLAITAAGFVDKYGPSERYDLLKHVPGVSVPQLYTFGSHELNAAAFRGLPEAIEGIASSSGISREVAIIAGADHVYSGCHTELGSRVMRWLGR